MISCKTNLCLDLNHRRKYDELIVLPKIIIIEDDLPKLNTYRLSNQVNISITKSRHLDNYAMITTNQNQANFAYIYELRFCFRATRVAPASLSWQHRDQILQVARSSLVISEFSFNFWGFVFLSLVTPKIWPVCVTGIARAAVVRHLLDGVERKWPICRCSAVLRGRLGMTAKPARLTELNIRIITYLMVTFQLFNFA